MSLENDLRLACKDAYYTGRDLFKKEYAESQYWMGVADGLAQAISLLCGGTVEQIILGQRIGYNIDRRP